MIDEKKLIERLEAIEEHCLDMHDWQGQSAIVEAKEIVNQLAEENKTCYKTCNECEAYDKEKHYCPKFCEVLKEAAKELAEEFNNGWISVNDRLPTEEGSYLVIGKTGGAVVTRWYEPSEYCPQGHFGGNSSGYIRYWMPRPQPPHSKEQSKFGNAE